MYLEVEFCRPGGGGGEAAFENGPAPGPRLDATSVDEVAVGLDHGSDIGVAITDLQPSCTPTKHTDSISNGKEVTGRSDNKFKKM
jgi:hypothetical protein